MALFLAEVLLGKTGADGMMASHLRLYRTTQLKASFDF